MASKINCKAWFRYRVCDKNRFSREIKAAWESDPFFKEAWHELWTNGDDNLRLVLADYAAEKLGNPWLSMFLRDMIFIGTQGQHKKKRQREYPRRRRGAK